MRKLIICVALVVALVTPAAASASDLGWAEFRRQSDGHTCTVVSTANVIPYGTATVAITDVVNCHGIVLRNARATLYVLSNGQWKLLADHWNDPGKYNMRASAASGPWTCCSGGATFLSQGTSVAYRPVGWRISGYSGVCREDWPYGDRVVCSPYKQKVL